MKTYAAFLRGINVGGNTLINMKELVSLFEKNQFSNVHSHINSGNIVFQSNENSNKLNELIKNLIINKYLIPVEVIIKTKDALRNIIENCPYKKDEDDLSKRLVAMLSESINKSKESLLKHDQSIIESYYIDHNLLYIYYINGVGKSKFSNNYIEKKLNVTSTSRNWNTLLKMLEIMNTYG